MVNIKYFPPIICTVRILDLERLSNAEEVMSVFDKRDGDESKIRVTSKDTFPFPITTAWINIRKITCHLSNCRNLRLISH